MRRQLTPISQSLGLVYVLVVLSILHTSCDRQSNAAQSKATELSETKGAVITNGPSTVVRTIKQDRKGNLWITSWEGVFKYDGKRFTNVTRDVTSARFFSLLEDRNGNLWMGTIGSGVYVYNGRSFQNFTTKDGLISDEIACIYEDNAGHIWLGASGGASRYDGISYRNFTVNGEGMGEDKTGKTFSQRQPYSVNSIIQDRTGKYWFATTDNTFVYDGNSFTVFADKGKPFKNIGNIIEDKKGNIWLGGTRYDGSGFSNFNPDAVLCVYEDSQGNIWTTSAPREGSKNWILSRYAAASLDSKEPTVTEINPGLGALFKIFEAHDGSLWVGSDGVYRYDGKTFQDFRRK